MFLQNSWYVAGFATEAQQKPFSRTILNHRIVFFRTGSGEAVALDNRCPHRYAPLDRGRVVGDNIQCAYHGLQFNAAGKCVRAPDAGALPSGSIVRKFPLVERAAMLWIWMGDADAADPALIPDFNYLQDPAFGWADGYIYGKCNYQLIVDNLLDLSHSEFLHEMLASKGWTAANRQKVWLDGKTLNATNTCDDTPILPIMKMARPELPDVGRTVMHERWDAPGLLRLSVEFYGEGRQIIIPSGHFVTPETNTSTHYFTRSGHDWEIDNPAVTAAYGAGVKHIFEMEDISIIEEQQAALGEIDMLGHKFVYLKHDGLGIRARRLLASVIATESAAQSASLRIDS